MCFSALQRAEIAEMQQRAEALGVLDGFSALQRAEIAEIKEGGQQWRGLRSGFSALQRAEIAEIVFDDEVYENTRWRSFSALQRAEIAEIISTAHAQPGSRKFQCSSTSRNC